jgi:ankyrin repeat protein
MKNTILLIAAIAFFSAGCASTQPSGRPDWAKGDENTVYNDGFVAAAGSGNTAALSGLLKEGADINSKTKDKSGVTALIKACENGDLKTAQFLLEKGADVNRISRYGYTPLMFAAKSGNEELVTFLLSKGARPDIIGHMFANAAGWSANEKIAKIINDSLKK